MLRVSDKSDVLLLRLSWIRTETVDACVLDYRADALYCRPSNDFKEYKASIDSILSRGHEPGETLVTAAKDCQTKFVQKHVGRLSDNKQILRLTEVSYSFGHVSDPVSAINGIKLPQSGWIRLISCAKIDYCRPLCLCKAESDQRWHGLKSVAPVSAQGLAGVPAPETTRQQRHDEEMLRYRGSLIKSIFQFDELSDNAVARLDAQEVCLPISAKRSALGTKKLSSSDER